MKKMAAVFTALLLACCLFLSACATKPDSNFKPDGSTDPDHGDIGGDGDDDGSDIEKPPEETEENFAAPAISFDDSGKIYITIGSTLTQLKTQLLAGFSATVGGEALTPSECGLRSVSKDAEKENTLEADWVNETAKPGEYTATYFAAKTYVNKAGETVIKTASASRKFEIVSKPVLSFASTTRKSESYQINGAAVPHFVVFTGTEFSPFASLTATDEGDPAVTKEKVTALITRDGASVQAFDTAVNGKYQIVFSVTNKYGRSASAARNYIVRAQAADESAFDTDFASPVIILPSQPLYIDKGAEDVRALILSGVTAVDGNGLPLTDGIDIFEINGVAVGQDTDYSALAVACGDLAVKYTAQIVYDDIDNTGNPTGAKVTKTTLSVVRAVSVVATPIITVAPYEGFPSELFDVSLNGQTVSLPHVMLEPGAFFDDAALMRFVFVTDESDLTVALTADKGDFATDTNGFYTVKITATNKYGRTAVAYRYLCVRPLKPVIGFPGGTKTVYSTTNATTYNNSLLKDLTVMSGSQNITATVDKYVYSIDGVKNGDSGFVWLNYANSIGDHSVVYCAVLTYKDKAGAEQMLISLSQARTVTNVKRTANLVFDYTGLPYETVDGNKVYCLMTGSALDLKNRVLLTDGDGIDLSPTVTVTATPDTSAAGMTIFTAKIAAEDYDYESSATIKFKVREYTAIEAYDLVGIEMSKQTYRMETKGITAVKTLGTSNLNVYGQRFQSPQIVAFESSSKGKVAGIATVEKAQKIYFDKLQEYNLLLKNLNESAALALPSRRAANGTGFAVSNGAVTLTYNAAFSETVKDFESAFGKPINQLNHYNIQRTTVKTPDAPVTAAGDKTFNFSLEIDLSDGLNSRGIAGYINQIKTISGYGTKGFNYARFTFQINSHFLLVSNQTEEQYVEDAIFNPVATTTTTDTFYYNEADFDAKLAAFLANGSL